MGCSEKRQRVEENSEKDDYDLGQFIIQRKRQKAIIRFAASLIICASNFQQIFEGYIKYTSSTNTALKSHFLPYFTYVAIYLEFEISSVIAIDILKSWQIFFNIF